MPSSSITGVLNNDPPRGFAAISPSDTVDLSPMPRGIYVGTGGNVVADDDFGNTSVTFTGVLAGTILPGVFKRVRTASTASNMVALY